MALASVLRSELPELHKPFSALSKTFPDDSEAFPEIPEILRDPSGPPRVLAAPPWGVQAVPDGPGFEMLHGTTTLAFKSPHGVTVAVDSRATAGSYIASQSVLKVLPISARILGTMAGGAADCGFWQRLVARQCRVHELRNKEPVSVAAASKLLATLVYQYKGMGLSLGTMVCGWDKRGPAALGPYWERWCRVHELRNKEPVSVAAASKLLATLGYQYKGMGLSLGTMVCGWDKRGPGLYYVDSEGQRVPGAAFAVGSGSSYAYGVLDRGLASHGEQPASHGEQPASPWASEEAACELARRAIYQAARRDAYSGGTVRVFHAGPRGWRLVAQHDVGELQRRYGE